MDLKSFFTAVAGTRPTNQTPSASAANHCYVPLDSDVSIQLDIQKNLSSDSSHLKEKLKEPSLLKLKKKVRFNLNIKAYEPIPDNDDVSIYLFDGEEETKFHTETTTTGDLQILMA
ncbi:hypothetical protein C2S53_012173 [Perilla frutescens var. hirtella]|uniref:Uncharacterized protein n=1 Tax=Perilla frutescens var. hirtella TaxID=608512 RepID=A0AAD4J8A6_PERFH|nr:hypothetical protein C2S53_012173 [Perilla frutescens var. hirtella]